MIDNSKKNRIEKLILVSFAVLVAGGILFIFFECTGIGYKCPFNFITGLKCPGCGTTHAIKALLHADIKGALNANFMCIPEFFYILWVYFFAAKNYINGNRFVYHPPVKYLDTCMLIIFLLWGLIRNIFSV